MNSSNQARLFEAKDSYFEPPKSSYPQNNSSPNNEKHTLEQSIKDFKLRGKTEGRAEKTMEQYDFVLGRLLEKISEDREVETIEPIEIRKHLAYLMDDGLADTSVAIHYRVLRAFFNWLVDVNYLSKSPMDNIRTEDAG